MSDTKQHLLEIRQELELLHLDGHCAESPLLFLEAVLIEESLNRMLQSLTEFTI